MTSSLWEYDNMLANPQVELHLLLYRLIMMIFKNYMKDLVVIMLHTVLLWQPGSPKGKFFTGISTMTEEMLLSGVGAAEVSVSR